MKRAVVIVTRQHPVPLVLYVAVLVLGILYVLDIATAGVLTDETNPGIVRVWELSLITGAALAVTSTILPLSRLPLALLLESVGVFVMSLNLGVYAVSLLFGAETSTGGKPWGTITMFGAVAIGFMLRAFTAIRDRGRVLEYAQGIV